MIKYEVNQYLIPSAYPAMELLSSIRQMDVISNPINIRRVINWKRYTYETVYPMVAYIVGFIDIIKVTKKDNKEDLKSDNKTLCKLYGFIHSKDNENGDKVYVLEYAICENENEAEITRKKLAKLNNTSSRQYWMFLYGEYEEADIIDMLYDKLCYVITIDKNKKENISMEPIPVANTYICSISKAKSIINKENIESDNL